MLVDQFPAATKLWTKVALAWRAATVSLNLSVISLSSFLKLIHRKQNYYLTFVCFADVIDRLNVLRGRGMPSIYSWSCKRSYKNGFVWHDLSEDNLILPAHGNEYVLKDPTFVHSQEASSSSSSMVGKDMRRQEEEISPPLQRLSPSSMSSNYRVGKNPPWGGSLTLTEYKVSKGDGAIDAST
uniref:SOSEKI DIX-like domain-containing protein n=1 Tax=Nelumbo nucifera TaxID=4432 RepID=A0A822YUV0_NELNU|nr:TPA_asm: hypothetical protein HUJ06_006968 [Nelumbo nucifera]